MSEKITQEEQSPLIRRQVVWRNYSEQMTEKQNSVKTCTKSPKREALPIYGNPCSFNQKRKSCPYKAGMKRLKSYKSSNLLLWKFIFKSLQQQQLAFCSYQRTQPLVKFLNNTCLRSDFSTQPLSKLKNFYFCKKRCTTTINPYFLLMILQSLQFILFCIRMMILYQIVVRIWKRRFFWWRCTLHWRGEHGDLCRFWLWHYVLPWNSYKNQTDQTGTELHFQILWKTPIHSQQRSTYLFCWWAA